MNVPARWFDIVRMRLRSLVRRGRVDQELGKELRFHLDQLTEEKIAAGMSPEDAGRAAARNLGLTMRGLTQVQEECRDMRRVDLVETIGYDLRYALRALGRSPGFAIAMVLTLALSIGANSAIFSVIHGVLLRQLPYPQQDRVSRIFLSSAQHPHFPVNHFDFLDFRAKNRSFASMAIMTRGDLQLSGSGDPQRLSGFQVSAGYFRVLGLSPQRGREFDFRDELPGNERVVILSDRLWRTRFHSDPNIIGMKLRLDARPFLVVGVMGPEMQHPGNEYRPVPYGDTVDLWRPFTFAGDSNRRGSHFTEGIGRLKPGVSVGAANAELNALMSQMATVHPADKGWRVLVSPLYREIVGTNERMLLVLLGAVGLVLLIACANAANLLLARATGRRREIAVRLALGAARSRLVRQMLTESLLISVLGGIGATAIAIFGVKVLVAMMPAGFPRLHEIHVDYAVFAFTLVIALATGLVFGLAPALQSSRADVQQNLREGGRGSTGSARHLRLRNWLVVSEVSLACVLLIGAGLLLRSFLNLMHSDPGFRAEHVLTASVALPEETYKDGRAILGFYDRLITRLGSLPAVHAAGVASDLPWTGYDDNLGGFQIEGKQSAPNDDFHGRYHMTSPDYFRALGIPLIGGRFFNAGDDTKGRPVLIINRAMAQRYWPGENAVGKRINFFTDHPAEADWTTVVGVVGDVKDSPEKGGAEPAFWWPIPQTPFGFPSFMMAVRADQDPALLVNAVRNSVREIDPALAMADVRLMEQIADATMTAPRLIVWLVGLFAALAIALAAVGTYGVISYSVNQRMHEFGMRVALGAKPWDVLRLVLAQGVKLALGGVVIGVLVALALARVLRNLLFEVSAADPLTFGVVAVLALAVAMLACYLPARRATQADPVVALRAE
jgi:predicted permease